MIVKVKKTITREEVIWDKIICDLCKEEHPDGEWKTDEPYDISNTKVECEIGTNYPGDLYINIVKFDICPDCFKTKLIPWLESQGAEPTKENNWY